MEKKTLIEIKDMEYTYPDGTEALKGISLDIHDGDFVALLGQNGAGKTTFAKTLNGLLVPTSGYIKVGDIDTSEKHIIKKLVQQVGYVFQNPDHQLFNNTVKKELQYAPLNINLSDEEVEKRVKDSARVAGIREEHMEEHPFFLTKGLRQRVSIGSILALKPKVIIVDEPTTGQDFKQSLEVMNFLKMLNEEQGHTIIIITHEMDVIAKYARRVIALAQGKVLLDGTTDEVFAQADVLATTFVKPPEVTQIAHALKDLGMPANIIDLDHLEKEFTNRLEN